MISIRHAAAALSLVLAPAAAHAFTGTPRTLSPTVDAAGVQSVDTAALTAGEWQTYVEDLFLVPRGFSFSPVFDFNAAGVKVDALRVELFADRGDICSAGLYAVDVATSPLQNVATRFFPDQTGTVRFPGTTIYKAVVLLQQAAPLPSRCVMRLSGLGAGGTDNPNTGSFTMLGALSYQGGLAQQDIAVAGAKVTQFWVRMPQFCTGVEVLEGGTVTEGQYDKARLVDANKMIFEVNGGAGARVGAVRVVFNGPRDHACDVPVYVKSTP